MAMLPSMTQSAAHDHFVIRGLRLGMTSQEVLSILNQRHRPSAVRILTQPCVSDYVDQRRKKLNVYGAPNHCARDVDVAEGNSWLLVFFVEDLPARPGTTVAYTIAINLRTTSRQAAQALTNDVLTRFGPPTLHDHAKPSWVVAAWCTDLPCHDMNKVLGPRSPTTLFLHRGSGLTLADQAYQNARDNYAQRYLALRGIVIRP